MGIGVSLILIAIGAVLAWAVGYDTRGEGFNLQTIGYILLGVGGFGLLLSLMFWSSWGSTGPWRREREPL